MISRTPAASTIFLTTNFLIALSLGTQRAQLVHLTGLTCPRPFLALPLFLLFDVCKYWLVLVWVVQENRLVIRLGYKLAERVDEESGVHLLTILIV